MRHGGKGHGQDGGMLKRAFARAQELLDQGDCK